MVSIYLSCLPVARRGQIRWSQANTHANSYVGWNAHHAAWFGVTSTYVMIGGTAPLLNFGLCTMCVVLAYAAVVSPVQSLPLLLIFGNFTHTTTQEASQLYEVRICVAPIMTCKIQCTAHSEASMAEGSTYFIQITH